MCFTIRPMDGQGARAVAAWRYDPPYDFYNADEAPDDLAKLDGPPDGPEGYYAVFDAAGELIGFFCFGADARVPGGEYPDGDALDVGLGLRPDLTGRGLGPAFLRAGLDFARRELAPARFRLSVAAFNRRAIRVYERSGFAPERVFLRRTDGGEHEFVQMSRSV